MLSRPEHPGVAQVETVLACPPPSSRAFIWRGHYFLLFTRQMMPVWDPHLK